MAKSTYLSANLTDAQRTLLQALDDYEVLYFSLEDLHQRIHTELLNKNELVENLYQKGFLKRIERGVYARPQFMDIHVLATFISHGGVVAYWSALHLHGLTERFPNKEFIKTSQRKRPTKILGAPVQFVTVKPNKLREGTIKQGYGDKSYPLTDLEMTLIDCFDQPRYAGDWPDLLQAFQQSQPASEKLIRYAQTYQNIALIKRMGYLAELFHKEALGDFIAFAQARVNQKYTLFEPGGPDEGSLNHRWKLRMNMTEEDIIEMAKSPY